MMDEKTNETTQSEMTVQWIDKLEIIRVQIPIPSYRVIWKNIQ